MIGDIDMSKFNRLYDSMSASSSDIIEQIKTKLYTYAGVDTWKEFVDEQEIGDCQFIVASIIHDFPDVIKVFGHIKLDDPVYSIDEDRDIDEITHHWVEIDGKQYDFSKGTLKYYIELNDIYNPDINVEHDIYESL